MESESVFWPVWMHLGLIGNRFWFLNFKEGPSILDSQLKYWCFSYQIFSEIAAKNWRSIITILKTEAVHIQA